MTCLALETFGCGSDTTGSAPTGGAASGGTEPAGGNPAGGDGEPSAHGGQTGGNSTRGGVWSGGASASPQGGVARAGAGGLAALGGFVAGGLEAGGLGAGGLGAGGGSQGGVQAAGTGGADSRGGGSAGLADGGSAGSPASGGNADAAGGAGAGGMVVEPAGAAGRSEPDAGSGGSADAGSSPSDAAVVRRVWTFASDLEGWSVIEVEQPDSVEALCSHDASMGAVPGSAKVELGYVPGGGTQTCRFGIDFAESRDLTNMRLEIQLFPGDLPYWIRVAAMIMDGSGRILEGQALRLTSVESNAGWQTLTVTPNSSVTSTDIRYLGLVIRYDSGGYGLACDAGLCDGACCSRAYSIINIDNVRTVNLD